MRTCRLHESIHPHICACAHARAYTCIVVCAYKHVHAHTPCNASMHAWKCRACSASAVLQKLTIDEPEIMKPAGSPRVRFRAVQSCSEQPGHRPCPGSTPTTPTSPVSSAGRRTRVLRLAQWQSRMAMLKLEMFLRRAPMMIPRESISINHGSRVTNQMAILTTTLWRRKRAVTVQRRASRRNRAANRRKRPQRRFASFSMNLVLNGRAL